MASLGIQMIQINLHYSKSASAILARSMAVMHTNIALIQEPWIVKGALSSGNLTVIKVRVKLAEEEDMEVLIGLGYMPYDSTDPSPHEEVKNLVAYAEARGLELLLGYDANSHHVGWGSTDTNLRGESLHDYLMGTGLTIFNRGNKPTFLDSRRQNPENKIHWWNKELGKLRLETRKKFSKAKRTGLAVHWEAFRSFQREYSKKIKKSKCKSWRRFCESIESAPEASRLHRILSLNHRPQLGCLKLPTGNVTKKATDTLKHLIEIHFPGFDHNIQPCRPKPIEYKPRDWRLAAESLSKPSRNGHIAAKDFRPISLTSFVLKTLERLVDRYLKIGPLLVHPLSPAQYAYREGRSTDTALHHFVGGIKVQLEAKGYALGIFLDIKGAFDSTSYDVIREAMTGYHIPAALADWTQSMLTGRTLIANHGDSSVHGFPAKGYPQAGVLSPLLWCLVADERLRELQKKGFLFGYADDVAIIVQGSFLSTLKETMQKALKIMQDWCQSKELRANPLKTKAMIFTRKYKPEAIEPLRLWREDIEYVQSIKYLGVYLDTKLNWKTHLDIKRSKFYASY
ncbi:uncharacterized protein LOC109862902 [Pseudomyrmex gracilis]|uniref:uncharacterized protein LOC109862902 n=1 Tax=Pseudomyrmex gracilis TaxID=219809 RepID=UPI00099526C4|nr:uncharacterized protein LOC109862902 [Pseudomyrmex gracilis]